MKKRPPATETKIVLAATASVTVLSNADCTAPWTKHDSPRRKSLSLLGNRRLEFCPVISALLGLAWTIVIVSCQLVRGQLRRLAASILAAAATDD